MSGYERNFDLSHPTYDEIQVAIAQAHVLRAQVMREGLRKLSAALAGLFAARATGLSRKHA